ncbi:CHC2 zinc finger domain-containing protein [Bacillus cereus group sp. TH260-2LC]|uniref:CHC2 zinc finger domain-containing protein n=2 Tax=Bacillus TaxID=1386 RepID=UPI0011A17FB5|nr:MULTISPECIES: CHC2 zinc finger domain-containing protein [Bacillus cereus group]MDA1531997.1 CHC2 zinc finger domain-containing protein [Bacillus cereus group sp. TH260-2LC]
MKLNEKVLLPQIDISDIERRTTEFKQYIKMLQIDERNQFFGRIITEKIINRDEEIKLIRKNEEYSFTKINIQFFSTEVEKIDNLEKFKVWLDKPNKKQSYDIFKWNAPEKIVKEKVYGGCSFYLVINPGGQTGPNIKKRTFRYFDADFGKEEFVFEDTSEAEEAKKALEQDENNQIVDIDYKPTYTKLIVYKTVQYITEKKAEFLKKHETFLELIPIYETYNGIHGYIPMVVEEIPDTSEERNTYLKRFSSVQAALNERLGTDVSIIDINRVLRPAGSLHLKRDPFVIRCINMPKELKLFTDEELIKILKLQVNEKNVGQIDRKAEPIEYKLGKKKIQDENRYTIRKPGTVELNLKRKTDFPEQTMTESEFIYWVKRQSIHTFFEDGQISSKVHEKMSCHFHFETVPSAAIHVDEDTGIYHYHCFGCANYSGDNAAHRDIFRIVQETKAWTWKKTIKKLADLANVEIIESEYEKEQFSIFREAIKFSNNIEELIEDGEIFGPLSEILSSQVRQKVLLQLSLEAQESVVKEEFSWKGHNTFFAACSRVARKISPFMRKVPKNIAREINIICLLGFIEKVSYDCINEELRMNSERIRKENLTRKIQRYEDRKANGEKSKFVKENQINFYIIKNPKDAIFEAERIAKIIKETKFTITDDIDDKKKISAVFGNEIANRVFPNSKKVVTDFENNLKEKMEKKISKEVNKKGYCLETEVLKVSNFKINGKYPKKEELDNVYSTFVKKAYSGALRVNNKKELREQFGYTDKKRQDIWLEKR